MAGPARKAGNKSSTAVESTMEFAFTNEHLPTIMISSREESKETVV